MENLISSFYKQFEIKKLRHIAAFSYNILVRYNKLSAKNFLLVLNNLLIKPADETVLRSLYPIDECELCLVCPAGIGDTLITAGLVHAIKERYQIVKVMLLVKSNHAHIGDIFQSIDRVCVLDDKITFVNKHDNSFALKNQQLAPNNYFFAHFENYNIPHLLGYKNINLFDSYKALFKLGFDISLETPIALDGNKECDLDIFKVHNIRPGRTVLLAPVANSVKLLSNDFWLSVCKTLKSRDYDIVLNSYSGTEILNPYVTRIDLPLKYLAKFSITAGKVIALRSGLCDFLSLYPVDMTVLYPSIIWYSGKLIDGSGLTNMGFSNRVAEFEIDPDSVESKEFLNYLSNF
jgi:hypothetical protein